MMATMNGIDIRFGEGLRVEHLAEFATEGFKREALAEFLRPTGLASRR